ncbi:MAG TPA: DUF2157 domain-containing protein [Candidatus Methylomirabilis sp.]|nr:DUF2157 domain-containing protein [Candidatus Methylomirabilis sp.]
MIDKKQIAAWVKNKTITAEQAEKMLTDATGKGREDKANKIVTAILTIGALFFGIGAILFIASNWSAMSSSFKTVVLFGSTFGIFYLGFYLKYQNKKLPRVGESLIFLSSLLIGATIFLEAQIYNVDISSHALALVWLAAILPVALIFRSIPGAYLTCAVIIVWSLLYCFFSDSRSGIFNDSWPWLPITLALDGIFLFSAGGFSYLFSKLDGVARAFRLSGLGVFLLGFFLLTFKGFFETVPERFWQISVLLAVFSSLSVIFTVAALIKKVPKRTTAVIEHGLTLFYLFLILMTFFLPTEGDPYPVLFNFAFVVLIVAMIYIGYINEDIKIINSSFFWLILFVIARYFDFFWELLPRSIFFMAGGLVLVGGGAALEYYRRQIKKTFKS